MDRVTGDCRRLHDEKLCELYSPPNIIRMIKSRRMIWVGNVARMGARSGAYWILLEKAE
jgi:hypothetical protein